MTLGAVPNPFTSMFRTLAHEVQDTFDRARATAASGDPQQAGHEGEATWATVLDTWGPNWPVVTRKYVVGPGGTSSEVDLLVMKPDYPQGLLRLSHVLSSGVAAAFEVRLNFRKPDLAGAILKKRQLIEVAGTAGRIKEILCGPFPFGLLSHSTQVATGDHPTLLMSRLYGETAYGSSEPLVRHPAEELDAWLIADRAFAHVSRMSGEPADPQRGPDSMFATHLTDPGTPGMPIAHFIVWLSRNWAQAGLLPALDGLQQMIGYGGGGNPKVWPLDVYPAFFRRNSVRFVDGHPYGF